jgi:hypothetical protein
MQASEGIVPIGMQLAEKYKENFMGRPFIDTFSIISVLIIQAS